MPGILLLGGSGRLGSALMRSVPECVAPGSGELDLRDSDGLARRIRAVQALEGGPEDLTISLVGKLEGIERGLTGVDPASRGRLDIVHAPDRILPGESPVHAVRRRPGSSIVIGIRLLKDGHANAFVSAGSSLWLSVAFWNLGEW